MTIAFRCELCQHPYEVRADLAGRRARCKQCGDVFTIPAATAADSALDRYALDDEPPGLPPVPPVAATPAKKRRKDPPTSGIVGLARLPRWGYWVYQGLILAVAGASLLALGETKQILAIGALTLGLGPIFAWLLLNSRQGVAFRDGPVAGFAYLLFFPYRIYYRLTHPEAFQNQKIRKLTTPDHVLILVTLGTVVLLFYTVEEGGPLRRKRPDPPPPAWVQAARASIPAIPAPPVAPRLPGPRLAPRPTIVPRATPAPQPTFAGADPIEAEVEVAARADSPRAARRSTPRQPTVHPQFTFDPPIEGAPPASLERTAPRPHSIAPGGAPPAPAPEATVTVTVTGLADAAALKRFQDALTALIDRAGRGHNLQFHATGTEATFTAAPIADPPAFAAGITFGRVTRVDGRTIAVEANP